MSSKKFLRKNNEIRAQEVRVINESDEQLGVMNLQEALSIAKEKELDLIEVSPKAEPPVCKIMDYGHYLYRQKKAENKQRRLSKAQETKQFRLGIRISDHDLDVRIRRAIEFLQKRHPVKFTLHFRGREASHADIGLEKIEIIKKALEDIASVEGDIKRQGRNMIIEFRPLPNKEKSA